MHSIPGVRVGRRRVRATLAAVSLIMTTAFLATEFAIAPRTPRAWAAEPESDPPSAAPVAAAAQQSGKLQHLGPDEAASVLGRPVRGPKGQDIGRVVDVLVDQAGHPRAAVIDFGGFMGVGSRKVAVDWHLLRFAPHDRETPITLELTADQIKAAPEYKPGNRPVIVTAPLGQPAPTEGLSPANARPGIPPGSTNEKGSAAGAAPAAPPPKPAR